MTGKDLLYKLRLLLSEDADSSFLDTKTSYSFLNEAAIEFVSRTACLKAEQSITTVADQVGYTLNADFIELYLKNEQNNFYLKYSDGTSNTFILWKDYEDIVFQDDTNSTTIPSHFTIIDDATLDSQATGTATSNGALSGGQATLSDTAGDFSDVSAGDSVHNTTDDSDGVVLSKTSSTEVVTALFGGTDNDWDSSDAYVIQPQGRLQLRLNPPPSTAGHTLTVFHIQRPVPVFSDYGTWRFQPQSFDAIIKKAAYLYKYRDQEPDFGNAWLQAFELEVRRLARTLNGAFRRRGYKVNFRGRQ